MPEKAAALKCLSATSPSKVKVEDSKVKRKSGSPQKCSIAEGIRTTLLHLKSRSQEDLSSNVALETDVAKDPMSTSLHSGDGCLLNSEGGSTGCGTLKQKSTKDDKNVQNCHK